MKFTPLLWLFMLQICQTTTEEVSIWEKWSHYTFPTMYLAPYVQKQRENAGFNNFYKPKMGEFWRSTVGRMVYYRTEKKCSDSQQETIPAPNLMITEENDISASEIGEFTVESKEKMDQLGNNICMMKVPQRELPPDAKKPEHKENSSFIQVHWTCENDWENCCESGGCCKDEKWPNNDEDPMKTHMIYVFIGLIVVSSVYRIYTICTTEYGPSDSEHVETEEEKNMNKLMEVYEGKEMPSFIVQAVIEKNCERSGFS